jgi:hypothetical protein
VRKRRLMSETAFNIAKRLIKAERRLKPNDSSL